MVSVRGGQFVIQVRNTITTLFTHLLEGVCISYLLFGSIFWLVDMSSRLYICSFKVISMLGTEILQCLTGKTSATECALYTL